MNAHSEGSDVRGQQQKYLPSSKIFPCTIGYGTYGRQFSKVTFGPGIPGGDAENGPQETNFLGMKACPNWYNPC